MSFVVAAVGVPLPVGPAKDRSVAFPCMDRSCGCHDAADCKKHCCCFSSEEKLAWSAEHGVDPTPFVDDRALAALPTNGGNEHAASPACGACTGERSACDTNLAASCCAKKSPPAGHKTPGLLTIAAYRQCTGLASLWTLVHAALPPPNPVECEFHGLVTGRVAQQGCLLAAIRLSPPTPPPRA
ncbi:MAG TPA: hypothetical protein VG125_26390 [Pirellulales bacterium]|nr:hypothetical protein [Pirellulales bacterium]